MPLKEGGSLNAWMFGALEDVLMLCLLRSSFPHLECCLVRGCWCLEGPGEGPRCINMFSEVLPTGCEVHEMLSMMPTCLVEVLPFSLWTAEVEPVLDRMARLQKQVGLEDPRTP